MAVQNNYNTKLNIYIDIMNKGRSLHYYNYELGLKEPVYQALKDEINNLYWPSGPARGAGLRAKGPNGTGVVVAQDLDEIGGEISLFDADNIRGIMVDALSREKAELVLQWAKYLCPVDKGYLQSTGHIEQNGDGSYKVVFDCSYAWYVHEFSWRQHKFPGTDHFLEKAVNIVNSMM